MCYEGDGTCVDPAGKANERFGLAVWESSRKWPTEERSREEEEDQRVLVERLLVRRALSYEEQAPIEDGRLVKEGEKVGGRDICRLVGEGLGKRITKAKAIVIIEEMLSLCEHMWIDKRQKRFGLSVLSPAKNKRESLLVGQLK